MKCPICDAEVRLITLHLKKHFKTKEEIYDFYFRHFHNTTLENVKEEFKQGETTCSLQKKYKCTLIYFFKSINLHRTASEAKRTSSYKKNYEKTIQERYGVDNISKHPDIKRKKKETHIKNYGTENNFCDEQISSKAMQKLKNRTKKEKQLSHQKTKQTLQQRYGNNITNPSQIPAAGQKIKKALIDRCKKMSPTEKQKMTLSARKAFCGQHRSKLEDIVANILIEHNKQYENNCQVENNNCDFVNKKTKTILEIFGDFWHACPLKYKATDIIPKMNLTAKDIWKRDKKKIDYLKSLGYTCHIIWEHEIRRRPKKEIEQKLKEMGII